MFILIREMRLTYGLDKSILFLPKILISIMYLHSRRIRPVYTIPFSYENGMEMLSYENGIL